MSNLFKKLLWIDTETTGTDPSKHGIIQLAALMEIGGEVVDSFNLKFQPHQDAAIDQSALDVTGTTMADLANRAQSNDAYFEFLRWIGKHIDKYDKADKAYPAGYNAKFDFEFLQAWAYAHGNKYGFGSYHNWRMQDPLAILYVMDAIGTISLPDYKLGTACAHYGIQINAHDALSDVGAARTLYNILIGR
ncbi:MAG: 3'-5' exonuclease [Chlorobiaceae bacterium]|nr:3'-5' exonuclease [Chlorobiaceae bacterium]